MSRSTRRRASSHLVYTEVGPDIFRHDVADVPPVIVESFYLSLPVEFFDGIQDARDLVHDCSFMLEWTGPSCFIVRVATLRALHGDCLEIKVFHQKQCLVFGTARFSKGAPLFLML